MHQTQGVGTKIAGRMHSGVQGEMHHGKVIRYRYTTPSITTKCCYFSRIHNNGFETSMTWHKILKSKTT
jgi:hypothetical protein